MVSAVPARVTPPVFRLRSESGAYSQAPPSRFPRRYASFGAMTVGTHGLTCEFNWQCTTDDIGYPVMITARLDSLPSPHFHGLGPPRPGGSRGEGKDNSARESFACCVHRPNTNPGVRIKYYSYIVFFAPLKQYMVLLYTTGHVPWRLVIVRDCQSRLLLYYSSIAQM